MNDLSNIEHWVRLAVLSWDRQGMPNVVRALTPGGMALREGETEYVRADLHRGAVEAVRAHRDRWYEANSKSPEEARPSDRELWRVVLGDDGPGGQS
jgi:hypothetical protein